MVTMVPSPDEVRSRIRENPHWEVVIHPSKFEAERIPSLKACRDAVEQAQVVLLPGREYPRTGRDYEGQGYEDQGTDWVASTVCLKSVYHEYWRLYQSGQFVHSFTFIEDTTSHEDLRKEYEGTPRYPEASPASFLLVLGALYYFTGIFEFAARLIAAGVLDEAPAVRIAMHQIKARALILPGRRLGPLPPHMATSDKLEHEWQFTGPGIYGQAARLAREAALWFFDRFHCGDISEEWLKREQEEFLAKRGLPFG